GLLRAAPNERSRLFVQSEDRTIDTQVTSLLSPFERLRPLRHEDRLATRPILIAYRSFDRQWLLPDSRLMVRPRPPLWMVRGDTQVYITEQSNHAIKS